jgi:uncharacterized membrane protein (DUF485 family)
VDPTSNPSERQDQPGMDPEESAASGGKHWSPFSTSRARWAWGLLGVFAIIYFAVAVLTSAEFAELAATEVVLGLPLGFILGITVIISGLIVTRIFLSKVEV